MNDEYESLYSWIGNELLYKVMIWDLGFIKAYEMRMSCDESFGMICNGFITIVFLEHADEWNLPRRGFFQQMIELYMMCEFDCQLLKFWFGEKAEMNVDMHRC